MSLGRELLLYCTVMVHVSFMGSQATGNLHILRNVTFDLPLCNLLMAEQAYVKHLFNDSLPKGFDSNTSKPFWGITLPAENNSGEVLAFVDTVMDCLHNAVPAIVTSLTQPQLQPHILEHITPFRNELEQIRRLYKQNGSRGAPARCPKQITACDDFCRKHNGLRILLYARDWVMTFASCDE